MNETEFKLFLAQTESVLDAFFAVLDRFPNVKGPESFTPEQNAIIEEKFESMEKKLRDRGLDI